STISSNSSKFSRIRELFRRRNSSPAQPQAGPERAVIAGGGAHGPRPEHLEVAHEHVIELEAPEEEISGRADVGRRPAQAEREEALHRVAHARGLERIEVAGHDARQL